MRRGWGEGNARESKTRKSEHGLRCKKARHNGNAISMPLYPDTKDINSREEYGALSIPAFGQRLP